MMNSLSFAKISCDVVFQICKKMSIQYGTLCARQLLLSRLVEVFPLPIDDRQEPLQTVVLTFG